MVGTSLPHSSRHELLINHHHHQLELHHALTSLNSTFNDLLLCFPAHSPSPSDLSPALPSDVDFWSIV